ncbi:MAG: hypothetical protein GX639_18230 [Fibrobacter sp.]|nr:hypothetical protein [Fibrobacter sp.]
MSNEFQAPTDKKNKIKVESEIVIAQFQCNAAVANNEVPVYVKTVFVGDGASIEIKGKSSEGKAPGTIKGEVRNNCFYGKLLIPEKVKDGAEIWFEAKLPKHGCKLDSEKIPARPIIEMSRMEWDRTIVHRGEIAKATIEFADGVTDGTKATMSIYEYSPEGYHTKVLRQPMIVENSKLELNWVFDYKDVDKIPTQAELEPKGRTYAPPKFFFVVDINGVRVGEDQMGGLLEFRDKLKFQVLDECGVPIKDKEYVLSLPDGTTKQGNLDNDGMISETDLPPGKIFVNIPEYPDLIIED